MRFISGITDLNHLAAAAAAAAASQTSSNIINFYSVYVWKDAVLPMPPHETNCQVLPKVDLYIRASFRLDLQSSVTAVSGDSRFILIGCEDGTVAALSWSGKVIQHWGSMCVIINFI